MNDFYPLSKVEEDLIKNTTVGNYIPTFVIRSQYREQHFGHQLKGILKMLKYDFEKYGPIRVEWINQEKEFGLKIMPKYITVIYLTPQAYEIYLNNRWHIFKLKRINKWDEKKIELLFKNEDDKYYDAMTLPAGIVDIEKSKDVCNFVERNFPEIDAKVTSNNEKALIHFSIEDRTAFKCNNKPRLQAIIAKAISERFKVDFLNCNGRKLDKIIVPEKSPKKTETNVDTLER